MFNAVLTVNGRRYDGWKDVRVTRGIESIAGRFELAVSERWAGESKWPIFEEDECTISLDGGRVITGYVDSRSQSLSDDAHTFAVSGRDKTGMLVDCSAVLKDWEFINQPVLSVARKIAGAFGIPVTMQGGLKLPAPPISQTVNPGDSAFEVIERACRLAGLLPVSDGAGGLLLTRTGTARTHDALVEGRSGNLLSIESSYEGGQRYRRYQVLGQFPGSDDTYGPVLAVDGRATDLNVRRAERVLLVRPEGNTTPEYAQSRAKWEATVRAARAEAIQVTVQGWQQSDGALWPPNALVALHSPMLGIDRELLITEVTYSQNDSTGTITQMTLMRSDAFTPEPVIARDIWNIADED